MPSTFSFELCNDSLPWQGTCHIAPQVAGSRAVLEESSEANPPPAGTSRVQTVFVWTGFGLMGLLMGTAVWILIRGYL